MGAKIDYTGKTVGFLFIESESEERSPSGAIKWNVLCGLCGSRKRMVMTKPRLPESCGCLQAKRAKQSNTKHGMNKSKIYSRWEAMIQRCTNKNNKQYKDYGARGIKVCKRWMSFTEFYNDIGDIPYDGATIDRIDNNAGYSKGNCEWSTMSTQVSNERNRGRYKKGVTLHQGKFRARLKKKGKIIFDQSYETEDEAHLAYLKAKIKHYSRK